MSATQVRLARAHPEAPLFEQVRAARRNAPVASRGKGHEARQGPGGQRREMPRQRRRQHVSPSGLLRRLQRYDKDGYFYNAVVSADGVLMSLSGPHRLKWAGP